MSDDAKSAAEEYKLTLNELTSNNKTQINLLTILAEDYKAFAEQIVNTIEKHIYTVKPPLKLVIIYVCDSIIKNVKGVYVVLFNKIITKLFLHTFQSGTEATRASLYKVRMTWCDIFPASRLYEMDMKVNNVDSAWPIANPKTGRALRTDPEVKAPSQPQEKVLVNRKFLNASGVVTARRPEEKKPQQMKKEIKEEPIDPLDKLLPVDFKATNKQTKRKAETLAPPEQDVVKRRRTPPFNTAKDQDLRPAPVIRPTNALGSHAFATAPQQSSAPAFPTQLPLQPPTLTAPEPLTTQPKPVITNGAVRLDIPENNRLFIDNKAYEVFFIGEDAVIEKMGLPHKIYFCDRPRNILIDNVPYLLAFGERKKVVIDGVTHEIRYGAPSRELYMGDYPFRGHFGGAPIIANINGKRHEIKLTGSAPVVKIDPEPTYDLARQLTKVKSEREQERNPAPEPQADPFALLKQLKKSGFLKPLAKAEAPPAKTPEPRQQQRQNPTFASPSSIPDRVDVERRPEPPSLKDFNIRLLKVRYDSVVSTLLTKRNDACKLCGMLMDGTNQKSTVWTEHMDWHVKRNLSRQETTYWQPWYPSGTAWLTPRVNEERTPATTKPQPEAIQGVIAEELDQKDCPICHEKFEEFYDDEEETWRLRNTIKVHGKTVHSACANDVTISELIDESHTEVKEEPIDVKETKVFDSKDFLKTLLSSQKC